ncbi:MAG: bifunctional phosphopantothenoylcysteine decarboxylase/phosphopantothenate--cysteine ligase CoaBC, partial [bacterium]
MLKDKNILLGISGSIAAYKAPELVRLLKKQQAKVKIVLTGNAVNFVGLSSLATLSENSVSLDMFKQPEQTDTRHISLSEWADLFLVAPATANIIAKFANGISDDFLSTTYLGITGPVILAPAMNSRMYLHPATQNNIKKLKKAGVMFIEPEKGPLACGDSGIGRMAEPSRITDTVSAAFTGLILKNYRVLVTAGGTREKIDPVRCITNFSSGKMGHAFANTAAQLGAEVTLIST